MTRPLKRELVAILVLSLGFVAYTQAVALGGVRALDVQTMLALRALWVPDLLPLFQAIAVLGGIEVASVLAAGLALYLWRSGFRSEAWALLVLPLVVAVELAYKRLLVHPEPIPQHPDGPSLSELVRAAHLMTGNSYPSGHVMRAVVVYGLMAFVAYRLSPPGWLHRLAVPAAAVIISAMAFDRLYLAVHWESDVVGGLLVGGLALAAAIAWLDRPRVPDG
jgi:membrane-associated phospholipid phosphatase